MLNASSIRISLSLFSAFLSVVRHRIPLIFTSLFLTLALLPFKFILTMLISLPLLIFPVTFVFSFCLSASLCSFPVRFGLSLSLSFLSSYSHIIHFLRRRIMPVLYIIVKLNHHSKLASIQSI